MNRTADTNLTRINIIAGGHQLERVRFRGEVRGTGEAADPWRAVSVGGVRRASGKGESHPKWNSFPRAVAGGHPRLGLGLRPDKIRASVGETRSRMVAVGSAFRSLWGSPRPRHGFASDSGVTQPVSDHCFRESTDSEFSKLQ